MKDSERIISSSNPGDRLIAWSSRIAGPAHSSWNSVGPTARALWMGLMVTCGQSQVRSNEAFMGWKGVLNFTNLLVGLFL